MIRTSDNGHSAFPSRSAAAGALGVALAILLLIFLNGFFATPILLNSGTATQAPNASNQSLYRTMTAPALASPAEISAQSTAFNSNNPGPAVATIGNPYSSLPTITLLGVLALLIGLGSAFFISRKGSMMRRKEVSEEKD